MTEKVCVKKITKRNIKFKIQSLARRNVDKHLIRYILMNFDRLEENIMDTFKSYGMTKEDYECACINLKEARERERSEHKTKYENLAIRKVKRDYGKTIVGMLNSSSMRIIMKCCLESSIFKLKYDAKVKISNKETYIKTLEDYLGFINSITLPV